jgi:hypothetical protein
LRRIQRLSPMPAVRLTAVSVETHEHPKWTEGDPVVRYVLTRASWDGGAEAPSGPPSETNGPAS